MIISTDCFPDYSLFFEDCFWGTAFRFCSFRSAYFFRTVPLFFTSLVFTMIFSAINNVFILKIYILYCRIIFDVVKYCKYKTI